MVRMRVMFDSPQWVSGVKVTQAEVEVDQVICLSADGERLVNVAAENLLLLTSGDLPGSYVEAVRVQRPNAYRPWSPEDDEKLAALVAQGAAVHELIGIFDRRYGAIKSRIRKLKERGLIPGQG